MSRYETAFETMAERDTPFGAVALLERVDASMAEPAIPMKPQNTQIVSGLAVAAAAFLFVIAVGAFWVSLRPAGEVATQDAIDWVEVPGDVTFPFVASGPGGFLLWTPGILGAEGIVDGQQTAFRFSTDGRSWIDANPQGATGHLVHAVEATSDRWLLLLDDDAALVSEDAQTWIDVTWPDDLRPFVDQVIGTGTGFFAIGRDPLGEGTTLWWSSDGLTWAKSRAELPSSFATATIEGTAAGLAWYDDTATDPKQEIYHSTDGSSWVKGEIALPPDYAESTAGWLVEPVTVVDETWFAVGQVFSPEQAGSHLLVWTSADGITWEYRGSPDFGTAPGYSIGIIASTAVGDRLVVEPWRKEGGDFADRGGRRTEWEPETTVRGDIWASRDGVAWSEAIELGQPILGLVGAVTDSGQSVGLYIPAPRTGSSDDAPIETTIAPAIDPADLDQDGLELQASIIDDGRVTRDELLQALEGWKRCMEERGISGVTYQLDPDGSYGMGWESPTSDTGNAEDNFCRTSYLDQVAAVLWGDG